jgi:hypothetical protein
MASEFSTRSDRVASGENEPGDRIEALEERNRELETENERLRSVTGPKVTYRRAVVLLLLIAAAATGGTVLYPDSRDVLIGIAGTGAFGAVLLGVLVQEWFLSASVGRSIYDTLWENETRIASRLGVAETSRYVPTDDESLGVRLYLSRSLDDPVPPADALGSTVVTVDDHYALLLEPTGNELVALLERTDGALPGSVQSASVVLREAVVELFELSIGAEVVDLDVSEGSENRMRFRVAGSVLGDAARLDHPIRSLLGVGLARITDEPVESEAWTEDNGNTVFVFRWRTGPEQSSAASRPEANGEPSEPVEARTARDRNP